MHRLTAALSILTPWLLLALALLLLAATGHLQPTLGWPLF